MKTDKIYVASSWRCREQPIVVEMLRLAGFEVYDFKNPSEDNHGFHWSDVGVASSGSFWENYLKGLEHPIAEQGFKFDFEAMQRSDTCVLVLPCGRSAHLELGWFVGQGKKTAIYTTENYIHDPELMYKMCDLITNNAHELVEWCMW